MSEAPGPLEEGRSRAGRLADAKVFDTTSKGLPDLDIDS